VGIYLLMSDPAPRCERALDTPFRGHANG
jgi:hypothetical protein